MESAKKTIRLVMFAPPWRQSESRDDGDADCDLLEFGSQSELHIHGYYNVPPGYGLRRVPWDAKFIGLDRGEPSGRAARLSYNYSLVKIMVSLGQAIYTIFTLYQARGDQIAQFGYAAFGLTVAPYAVVSILNLLGSLLCPEFPVIYMVESSIMEEARRRGDEYIFEGTVGKVDEEMIQMNPQVPPPEAAERQRWVLEPVAVSVDRSGRQQVSSETQVELSYIIIENAKLPDTAVEEGLSCGEKVTDVTGHAPHNQTKNQTRMEIRTPAEGNHSTSPTNFKKIVQVNTEEPESTTTHPSSSSDHLSEIHLLVPLSNPIKREGRNRQIADYKIYLADDTPTSKTSERRWKIATYKNEADSIWSRTVWYSYLAALIPVMINGALSRFRKGHSTHAQRGWTMAWLSFGAFGTVFASLFTTRGMRTEKDRSVSLRLRFANQRPFFILTYVAPAIGGLVVVGQMLRSYGTCINVS
jgi:uncharacterized membrane protein